MTELPTQRPHPRADEDVQFTVYRPRSIRPRQWYPLLAFAHLSEKRPDALPGEPDPLEEVRRQAEALLGDSAAAYAEAREDARVPVPERGELRMVLELPGVDVNPPQASFLWLEAVHCETFRIRAPATLDGQTVRGQLLVFLGPLLIGELTLAIRVDARAADPRRVPRETETAMAYRRIFPSYSHQDMAIVEQFELVTQALGDTYLRDVTTLRAGEQWSDRLMQLIGEAQVFQLFWSTPASQSQFVRQEWLHALSLGRPNFVRPLFWEEPCPERPPELTKVHFHALRSRAAADSPPERPLPRQGGRRWQRTLLPAFGMLVLAAGITRILLPGDDDRRRPTRDLSAALERGGWEEVAREAETIAAEGESDLAIDAAALARAADAASALSKLPRLDANPELTAALTDELLVGLGGIDSGSPLLRELGDPFSLRLSETSRYLRGTGGYASLGDRAEAKAAELKPARPDSRWLDLRERMRAPDRRHHRGGER